MNTSSTLESFVNVAPYERAFRAMVGCSMAGATVTGVIAVPAAIFALSLIGLYLVMTAIMGLDPAYSLLQSITGRYSRRGVKPGQVCA